MYIHRIVTKGVKGLPDQDLTFWDEFRQEPLHSVLITGPNGSGKTTLLKVIAGLWAKLDNWLKYPNVPGQLEDIAEVLHFAPLAAIEIRGLIVQPLWLYEAVHQDPDVERDFIEHEAQKSNGLILGGSQGSMRSGESLTQTSWFKDLALKYRRLQMGLGGVNEAMPNMLFLQTENRYIAATGHAENGIQPEALYQWLVNYQATTQWSTHIEAMLSRLKLRDPTWFRDTLQEINAFLETTGKSITDFDDSLRLTVKIAKDGSTHLLSALSSGEQQFVILIFMMSRWLMPGGIMLIDEPDLYMHVSMQRYFISELRAGMAKKGSQLIVTSHSPEFWQEFRSGQSFNLNPVVVHG